MRFRSVVLGTWLVAATGGCSAGLDLVEGTTFETGTYTAVLFQVTPDGQAPIDVLLSGGSLRITFDRTGATTGTLVLPASVTGGAPLTASMAGTATITGLTVTFQQEANTFVREVTWSRIQRTIQLTNQRIGNAIYDVALQR